MPARTTFHDLIDQNRRSSMILMVLVTLFVVGLGVVFGEAWGNWAEGLVIAAAVAVVLALFSWFAGDAAILSMSSAREIEKKDEPQLFNVVEEMAIAAGIPMPKVYVIEDDAPNAFATGRDPEHATVAITRGLLEKLDRNELQGVIAHEMSHVRNYDIRFAMLMAVMVGVIVLMCDFFMRISFYRGRRRSSDRGGGQAQLVLMVIAIVLAILAPIMVKIIQMAASRQREYLADASAVELTRYPDGLAHALEKLAGDHHPEETANRATQHMYIVNPLNRLSATEGLFSTHPPIRERIARLQALGAGPEPQA